jgi:hypothetical protein
MKDKYDLVPELKRAGITQEDIAKEADCCQQNVSSWFTGFHNSQTVANAIDRLLKRARNAA